MATSTLYPTVASRGSRVTDRRRSLRHPQMLDAWLCPANDDRPEGRIGVVSVDVSRHGVGLGTPRELEVGSFHTIEIGFGEEPMVSEVRIVSCRPFEGAAGLFHVGAEFC